MAGGIVPVSACPSRSNRPSRPGWRPAHGDPVPGRDPPVRAPVERRRAAQPAPRRQQDRAVGDQAGVVRRVGHGRPGRAGPGPAAPADRRPRRPGWMFSGVQVKVRVPRVVIGPLVQRYRRRSRPGSSAACAADRPPGRRGLHRRGRTQQSAASRHSTRSARLHLGVEDRLRGAQYGDVVLVQHQADAGTGDAAPRRWDGAGEVVGVGEEGEAPGRDTVRRA